MIIIVIVIIILLLLVVLLLLYYCEIKLFLVVQWSVENVSQILIISNVVFLIEEYCTGGKKNFNHFCNINMQ